MKRILFVCHGNICRSPIAEYYMKALVEKAGKENEYEISSAATSYEEIGNPVYPPAKRKLAEHGIRCEGHSARHIEPGDYTRYDYLIGMDEANIRNMSRISGGDKDHKIYKLLSFSGRNDSVADPWYTGDFEEAYRDIEEGCDALFALLEERSTSK